jgi:hypothetical protein
VAVAPATVDGVVGWLNCVLMLLYHNRYASMLGVGMETIHYHHHHNIPYIIEMPSTILVLSLSS